MNASSLLIGHTGTVDETQKVFKAYLSSTDQVEVLSVRARYRGTGSFIPIPPSFVTYRIRPTDNGETIRIDPESGVITPIKVGHALVEASYGGLTYLACTVVEPVYDRNHYDASECEEVLRPGEALGLTH